LEFLVSEKIIMVPISEDSETGRTVAIPDWVRNNAKWWVDKEIDNNTFAQSLQYLIKSGIISVRI